MSLFRRLRHATLLFLSVGLPLALPLPLAAQVAAVGTIEGRVLNARSGEYLEGARMTVPGTAAQLFVIVEILVAQRQAGDPLAQQLRQGVIDKPRIALVAKAAGQGARQPEARVDLTQQRRAAIARQRAAGKIHHHFPVTKILKRERSLLTVCRRPGIGSCVN
jgi:hypothetical protein